MRWWSIGASGRHVVLATLVTLTSVAALAAAPQVGKKRPGRYKLGPVYLTPRLELKNAGVDTNVFNAQTGAIPDTSIVLSPSIAAAVPIGQRLRITGTTFLDFNYFRRKSSERSTDFAGEGRAEVDVGPFTLFGAGGGGQFKQRFSIDLDTRLLRQEKWATTGFDLRVTRKLSATVSGTGRSYAFDPSPVGASAVHRALDRNVLTGTTQIRYAITGRTAAVASADAIEDRFLDEPAVALRKARSSRYLGGFEFGTRAIINGKVMAGVREFPRGQSTPRYRGPALAVSASIPLLRFGRLAAIADRDVLYSVSSAGVGDALLRNSYVSTRLRGEAMVELPFGLIGRGVFGLQEAKYLLPQQLGSTPFQRVDHVWTGSASVLRQLGDTVRIGATLAWSRRVSTAPGGSYEGLRYGLQAEVVP